MFKKKFKMAAKNKILKQGKWGVYFNWNWPADHEYDNIQSIKYVITGKKFSSCRLRTHDLRDISTSL